MTQLPPQVVLAVAILVAALILGALGSVLGGATKVRLWYWSHTLIGLSVCVFGVAYIFWTSDAPMLDSSVVVEQVGIQTTGRGSELTNLVVRLPSGETMKLSASRRNEFFRPGQHMNVRYQQFTGLIDSATFLSPSGTEQAQYRSHMWIVRYALFGLGIVQIVSARRRYLQQRKADICP
jgi:hypothetical protein